MADVGSTGSSVDTTVSSMRTAGIRTIAERPWYGPLMVAGYDDVMALLVALPVAWRLFGGAVKALLSSDSAPTHVWDATVTVTIDGAPLALAAYLAWRDRHRDRTANPRQHAALEASATCRAPVHLVRRPSGEDHDLGAPPLLAVVPTACNGPYTAAGAVARALVPEVLGGGPSSSTTTTSSCWPSPQTSPRSSPATARRDLVGITGRTHPLLSAGACTSRGPRARRPDQRLRHPSRRRTHARRHPCRRGGPDRCRVARHPHPARRPSLLRDDRRQPTRLSGKLGAAATRPRRSKVSQGDRGPDEAVDVVECARRYVDSDCPARPSPLLSPPTKPSTPPSAPASTTSGRRCWRRPPVRRRGSAPSPSIEHGSDPDGAGVRVLLFALEQTVLMGFYDAVRHRTRSSLSVAVAMGGATGGALFVVAKVSTRADGPRPSRRGRRALRRGLRAIDAPSVSCR